MLDHLLYLHLYQLLRVVDIEEPILATTLNGVVRLVHPQVVDPGL